MSFDVFVQDIPAAAKSVDEIRRVTSDGYPLSIIPSSCTISLVVTFLTTISNGDDCQIIVWAESEVTLD